MNKSMAIIQESLWRLSWLSTMGEILSLKVVWLSFKKIQYKLSDLESEHICSPATIISRVFIKYIQFFNQEYKNVLCIQCYVTYIRTKFEECRSRPGDPTINRVPLLPRMDVWTEQRSSTSWYRYHKICSKICIF